MALLERPGEVVTRETLRGQLWSHDTFVEFEHALNAAINRLRQSLGDDAASPRFIETIPGRGYRLIVPVESPEPVPVVAEMPRRPSMPGWSRWVWLAPLAMVAPFVAGLWIGHRSQQNPPLPRTVRFTIQPPQ